MEPKLPYELRMKIWNYKDNGYKNKDIVHLVEDGAEPQFKKTISTLRWFYCRQAHFGTETTTHDDRKN